MFSNMNSNKIEALQKSHDALRHEHELLKKNHGELVSKFNNMVKLVRNLKAIVEDNTALKSEIVALKTRFNMHGYHLSNLDERLSASSSLGASASENSSNECSPYLTARSK